MHPLLLRLHSDLVDTACQSGRGDPIACLMERHRFPLLQVLEEVLPEVERRGVPYARIRQEAFRSVEEAAEWLTPVREREEPWAVAWHFQRRLGRLLA